MNKPKRYAVVGTGGRCSMFIEAICTKYQTQCELVGLCDISRKRLEFWQNRIVVEYKYPAPATFHSTDFDRMIAQQKPDVIIVTTMDSMHHQYIIRAMELGCDVITEKPMTIDEVKAKAIFDTIQSTGRKLRVTFNYRYMPAVSKLREIVRDGLIGTPTSVDFQWYLNTKHGADYFRRWHRQMQNSGGLLVHKSTHHFDMVNFIIDSYPEYVFAMGGLKFYGKANAQARGEHYDYQRYTGNVTPQQDPFAIDISNSELYYGAEKESGYIRDRNVFGDEPPIDIYDTHAVSVQYLSGTILNYSLYAFCPWEGERLTINGTKGQVEYFSRSNGHIIMGQSDAELAKEQSAAQKYIRLQRMFSPPESIPIPEAQGGHGGGDPPLLEQIFDPNAPADPLKRDANHIDGAASILTGIAANRSIQTRRPVRIDELMQLNQERPGV